MLIRVFKRPVTAAAFRKRSRVAGIQRWTGDLLFTLPNLSFEPRACITF